MVSNNKLKIETAIYFFALKSWRTQSRVVDLLKKSIESSGSGRIVGSGVSFCADQAYVVEVLVRDRDKFESELFRCCCRLKIKDFEIGCYNEYDDSADELN